MKIGVFIKTRKPGEHFRTNVGLWEIILATQNKEGTFSS